MPTGRLIIPKKVEMSTWRCLPQASAQGAPVLFATQHQRFKPGSPIDAGCWHTTCIKFSRVIRITTERNETGTVVTIDGQMAESDLGEIRRVRKSMKGDVFLNLRGLEACAAGGVRDLRAWLNAGAQLQDANPFLQMILKDPAT